MGDWRATQFAPIYVHLLQLLKAGAGTGAEAWAGGGRRQRRLLIISRAFLWPATVGGAQYVDTITFRQTGRQAGRHSDRQTDRPISVVSNSTHSQLERPINSLTGATLARHLARDGWRVGWREGKLEVLWGICFDSDSDSETAMWPVSHIKLINN